jgi:hypothetical protein
MCKIVVFFATIRCDIEVIFAARQRDNETARQRDSETARLFTSIFATRERDRRYFVRRQCRTLVIFTKTRDCLWHLFLISRLNCSIHFDLRLR